ncbi:MAG: RRXRR domain-containing protein, partial [Methanosarcinales archaeon]
MTVYVISKNGKPLMPTERHGKVRRLLKTRLAKVVKKIPFTIKLLYATTEYIQPVTVGVDIGSSRVPISAL